MLGARTLGLASDCRSELALQWPSDLLRRGVIAALLGEDALAANKFVTAVALAMRSTITIATFLITTASRPVMNSCQGLCTAANLFDQRALPTYTDFIVEKWLDAPFEDYHQHG